MNEAVIADLKQFIAGTVSQEIAGLKRGFAEVKADIHELKADIHRLDTNLNAKIDDLSLAVAEALEQTNDVMQHQFEDHELRLTRLEQRREARP